MDEVGARTIQIEDFEEIVVNAFEDIGKDEDESADIIKTKNKEARIKNWRVQATQTHELLAQVIILGSTFKNRGKIHFFP